MVFLHTKKKKNVFMRQICLRYASVEVTPQAGFGHKFGDIIFSYLFSQQMSAKPIFFRKTFTEDFDHEPYPWMLDFIGIKDDVFDSERDIRNFQFIQVRDWLNPAKIVVVKNFSDPCEAYYKAFDFDCNGGYCFMNYKGAFDAGSAWIRKKFESTPWGFDHRHWYLKKWDFWCISVVVHLRTGKDHYRQTDRACQGNNSAKLIIQNLSDYLSGQCLFFTIITNPTAQNLTKECLDFGKNSTIRWTVESPPTLEAFKFFLSADILVSTGSSLPISAAALSKWVVHIAGLPKENKRDGYRLSGDIEFENGVFNSSKEKIQKIICTKIKKRRNFDRCSNYKRTLLVRDQNYLISTYESIEYNLLASITEESISTMV